MRYEPDTNLEGDCVPERESDGDAGDGGLRYVKDALHVVLPLSLRDTLRVTDAEPVPLWLAAAPGILLVVVTETLWLGVGPNVLVPETETEVDVEGASCDGVPLGVSLTFGLDGDRVGDDVSDALRD